MCALGRLLGRAPTASFAFFLMLTVCLVLDDCLLFESVNVSANTSRFNGSYAIQHMRAAKSFRQLRHVPQSLQSSPILPSVVFETTSQPDSPRDVADTSPLAFTWHRVSRTHPFPAYRYSFNSSVPAPPPGDAETTHKAAFFSAAGGSKGILHPEQLEGRYCCSVSHTQRLPTRTVVVGGGAAGAEAFDILHGKPQTVQQHLLHEKRLLQHEQNQHEASQKLPRLGRCVFLGNSHRIAVQTMANSDTRDVEATVQQVLRCAAAGADMVRLTVQGPREADASHAIVERLRDLGCHVPLVADIHFQPRVASRCSEVFEKIRVNPGNFADGRKVWEDTAVPEQQPALQVAGEESGVAALTPEKVGSMLGPWGSVEGLLSLLPRGERESFCDGHRRIEEVFLPLVEKCLKRKRAIRIGTNHGSLSARILRHFGDTPMGMVLSAVEFADICVRAGFYNFVFSLKSSNPATMQQAYRLMAYIMNARGALFPLHLGVTEAGEGEDGRIKSAAGIGALLQDGIGDTIRASLTEPPWAELPVCRFLRRVQEHKIQQAKLQVQPSVASVIPLFEETSRNFAAIERPGSLRLGQHPSASTTDTPSKPSQEPQTILHRDGTALVAIDPQELLNPASLFAALGLRVVDGLPFRTPLSADAVYIRSLFLPWTPEYDQQQQHHKQQDDGEEGLNGDKADRRSQLLAARRTLLQLQKAGLTVWADAREIQQVQMTREQLRQHLLQQHPATLPEREMLRNLDEASLHMPGLVAVQRLQDAAAVGSSLAIDYLKETAGLALVADGTETAEEVQAVVRRTNLLCVLVRPVDRAATGVAASRRVNELLRKAERGAHAGGKATGRSVPVIQWIEALPPELLSTRPTELEQQRLQCNETEDSVSNRQAMTMFAAWEAGCLLLDRIADGVLIDASRILSTGQQRQLALDLLQGCRMRSTKTEFISCPSCGRTLFDIQKVSAEIRRRTGHLPGVKIAVMGCIVNGIGEMGDADFGYVGGAPGLVDLYVGKKLIRRGVKSAEACDALIDVIKAEGRWKDPDGAGVVS